MEQNVVLFVVDLVIPLLIAPRSIKMRSVLLGRMRLLLVTDMEAIGNKIEISATIILVHTTYTIHYDGDYGKPSSLLATTFIIANRAVSMISSWKANSFFQD